MRTPVLVDRRTFDLARIAREVGCKVQGTAPIGAAGAVYSAVQVTADSNETAIDLLNALARYYAKNDAAVRQYKDAILRSVKARNPHEQVLFCAQSVHALVQREVKFQVENPETFRAPELTMRLACGDCDDHALLVCAIWLALGQEGWVRGVKNAEGEITHACAELLITFRDGRLPQLAWAETTIPARLGEHPHVAARRLGLMKDRKDITG